MGPVAKSPVILHSVVLLVHALRIRLWHSSTLNMNESLFGSPLFASALFGVAMFFFFRWVFVERYSAEEAKNYAILIAFVCAIITWGAFG